MGLSIELKFDDFKWIRREANGVAHCLAKWGLANRWEDFVNESSLPHKYWNVIRKDALSCNQSSY